MPRRDSVRPPAAIRAARARTFRRNLTDQETAATTDFQIIAARLEDRTTTLVRAWGGIRDQQVNELHAQIMDAAGDLNALAAIQLPAGSSIEETDRVLKKAVKKLLEVPGTEAAVMFLAEPEPVPTCRIVPCALIAVLAMVLLLRQGCRSRGGGGSVHAAYTETFIVTRCNFVSGS